MTRLSGKQLTLIALVVLVSAGFAWLLLPFYGALLWAVVLAVLFDPLQRWLVRVLRGRATLASAISVLACVCIVVIPGSLLLAVLARDASDFYQRIADRQLDPSAIFERIHASLPGPIADLMGPVDSVKSSVTKMASEGAHAAATRLLSIGQGTARFFVSLGVMLYVLFFLFRDGRRLLDDIRSASPLSDHHTQYVMERFTQVTKATVKGNFIVALVQGALGGVAFQVLGLEGALLWGVVMVVLSLLPLIGAAIVWVPAAAYLLISGEYARGIILLAVGVFVISMIDNFLRPMLVGKDIRMPDYLVLVSTLGGIALFGMNGFVVGPLIAALFIAVWSLLREERESGWTVE